MVRPIVRVTERDRRIFRFIFDNIFASARHIQKFAFQGVRYGTVKNRLNLLERGGYLRRMGYAFNLYRLRTPALFEVIEKEADIEKYKNRRISRNQLTHDIGVIDTKLLLQSSDLVKEFVPNIHLGQYERYERRGIRYPDAVFHVQHGDKLKKCALEYELTQKSSRRYENIFESYYCGYVKKGIDVLIYLVSSESLKKCILKFGKEKIIELAQRKVTHENKLYVATIETFQSQGLACKFESPIGGYLSFNGEENQLKLYAGSPMHFPSYPPGEEVWVS